MLSFGSIPDQGGIPLQPVLARGVRLLSTIGIHYCVFRIYHASSICVTGYLGILNKLQYYHCYPLSVVLSTRSILCRCFVFSGTTVGYLCVSAREGDFNFFANSI